MAPVLEILYNRYSEYIKDKDKDLGALIDYMITNYQTRSSTFEKIENTRNELDSVLSKNSPGINLSSINPSSPESKTGNHYNFDEKTNTINLNELQMAEYFFYRQEYSICRKKYKI